MILIDGDKDDDHADNDEFMTMMSMKERLRQHINTHNMHVTKMVLLCLAPGTEEDKKHNNATSSYPCLSERKNTVHHFRSQNRSIPV